MGKALWLRMVCIALVPFVCAWWIAQAFMPVSYATVKGSFTAYFAFNDLRDADLRGGFAAVDEECDHAFVKWGSYFTCAAYRSVGTDGAGRKDVHYEIVISTYVNEEDAKSVAELNAYRRSHATEAFGEYDFYYQTLMAEQGKSVYDSYWTLREKSRPSPHI